GRGLFGELQIDRHVGRCVGLVEQAQPVHQFARLLVVLGFDHPDRGGDFVGLGFLVGITELPAAVTLVAGVAHDAVLDTGFVEHARDFLDVLEARRSENLAHQLASGSSGSTRIRPSWATDATSLPSRVKIWPRARPRAFCAVGLSSEYSSQSSTRNGRWNHSAWSSEAIC